MQKDKKKHVGVHLDSIHAIIIAAEDNEAAEYVIQSKVKAEHSTGGEHAMNNAKQADTLKFFKSVSGLLLNYDELLIFGAGKAQEEFKNFLMEDAHFKTKKITIDTADNLTDPQVIAKVRDFYSAN
jgi:stalled ribosome rescue protein Dom34